MGNCVYKTESCEEDNIDWVLSAANRNSRHTSWQEQLRHEVEMERQLREAGIEATSVVGGMSFTVMVSEGKAKPPRRLDTLTTASTPRDYNFDDRQLIADILREEQTANKQLRVRQQQEKSYNARCRRAEEERSKKAKAETKASVPVPNVEERKRSLQKLAVATRAAREKRGRV